MTNPHLPIRHNGVVEACNRLLDSVEGKARIMNGGMEDRSVSRLPGWKKRRECSGVAKRRRENRVDTDHWDMYEIGLETSTVLLLTSLTCVMTSTKTFFFVGREMLME